MLLGSIGIKIFTIYKVKQPHRIFCQLTTDRTFVKDTDPNLGISNSKPKPKPKTQKVINKQDKKNDKDNGQKKVRKKRVSKKDAKIAELQGQDLAIEINTKVKSGQKEFGFNPAVEVLGIVIKNKRVIPNLSVDTHFRFTLIIDTVSHLMKSHALFLTLNQHKNKNIANAREFKYIVDILLNAGPLLLRIPLFNGTVHKISRQFEQTASTMGLSDIQYYFSLA